MTNVHLLVLCHGMWGSTEHLAALADTISDLYPKSVVSNCDNQPGAQYDLDVLIAESNQENYTYDGIDWGGERLVAEIRGKISSIEEKDHSKVTRFSITGYSLGGLLARYVIGALYATNFFDNIEPVNFTTIATPHLGIPKYPSFFSTMGTQIGPRLLGRTGLQFYSVDKSNGLDSRPLLEIMADHNSVFYSALVLFPNVTIYANSVNDTTVPYITAAIETHDPFFFRETNGLEIVLDDKHPPLLKSYTIPASPPVQPKPSKLSAKYWWSFKLPRLFLPPRLQFKFPFNLLIFVSFPVIFPLILTLALTRLSLDSRESNARIKLLEQDTSKVEFIGTLFDGIRKDMNDVIADYVDGAGPNALSAVALAATSVAGVRSETLRLDNKENKAESGSDMESQRGLGEGSASGDLLEQAHAHLHLSSNKVAKAHVISGSGTGSGSLHPTYTYDSLPPSHSKCTPKLTDSQRRMAKSLNALPQLKKKLVYIDHVMNSHAVIIARDMKRFKFHERGLGVVREWANSFVL